MLRRNGTRQHVVWCVSGWGAEGRVVALWRIEAKMSALMNQNRAGPEPLVAVPGQLKCVLGGVLLSRTLAGAVPSALSGLASGFGMGPGVSLSL